jgi:uncharacterized membrane protein YkgB
MMTSPARIDRLDRSITAWLGRHAFDCMRWGLAIVFLWFGFLKFFPSVSAAEGIATRTIETLTFGLVPKPWILPGLATLEVAIGLGLLWKPALRITLFLLAVQMLGTLTPLFLFPSETFKVFPIVPTLEGQYILKNLVLIAGAMVVGASVRGGRVVEDSAE